MGRHISGRCATPPSARRSLSGWGGRRLTRGCNHRGLLLNRCCVSTDRAAIGGQLVGRDCRSADASRPPSLDASLGCELKSGKFLEDGGESDNTLLEL